MNISRKNKYNLEWTINLILKKQKCFFLMYHMNIQIIN